MDIKRTRKMKNRSSRD